MDSLSKNHHSPSVPALFNGYPEHIPREFSALWPDTLTLITTYTCNAACSECCFGCNPTIKGRLSLESMKSYITHARLGFPALRLVVFTGGECFLLRQDLFDAIAHAHHSGLMTRCVTNGFWGKTDSLCSRTVHKLVRAGISEINISTGLDHQQWVPLESVVRAAVTLVDHGVVTLLTVEADTAESACMKRIVEHPRLQPLLGRSSLFRLQSNSWMPFTGTSADRAISPDQSQMRAGCKQLFHNAVITPQAALSACCGLTLEHIPEMRLAGNCAGASMQAHYYRQFEDFLKIWLAVDGPYTIMTRVLDNNEPDELAGVVHICQACVILHRHPAMRALLKRRYREFMPQVMNRFYLEHSLEAALLPPEPKFA